MISFLVTIFIGILTLLFESTALHAFSLHACMPNLTLILVAYFALFFGKEKGRRLGLILGLIQDLLFCPVLGFYGMIFFLIGHLCGALTSHLAEFDLLIPLGLVLLSDLIYGTISYFVFGFLQGKLQFFLFLRERILPEAIYTLLIALVMFPVFKWALQRLLLLDEIRDRKRRRRA